jgi:16S rRNA (guanine527-N7)-methyltransferase
LKPFDPPPDVSRETLDRLTLFVDLVTRWSGRINLVAKTDLGRLWPRHVIDCLQWVRYLPACSHGIDLGSGAGFPGLVYAIAANMPFELVEADQRKAAFLREAARETGAPVTVHATRLEQLNLPLAEVVTARALAPLIDLLPAATRFLAPAGVLLLPKGKRSEIELTIARTRWQMQAQRVSSVTDPDACLLMIREPRRLNNGC